MTDFDLKNYQPSDTLYLWWLGQPEAPRLIGELRMARQTKGVSLQYCTAWLQSGFPLSEDMPLVGREFFSTEKETAVGAVDDARPDRWGERVIRFLDKPPRLAVLDFLFYAGDERFGALGVSVSPDAYLARGMGPLPQLADAREIEQLVHQILAGEPIEERKRRLIAPGATMGGAHPKALLNVDGHPWVLKFNEPGEPIVSSCVRGNARLPRTGAMAAAARCHGGWSAPGADARAVSPHGVQHFDRQHRRPREKPCAADGAQRRVRALPRL